MPRPRFLADEHVPRVFTSALLSNGFEVERAQERYGQQTDDRSVLDDCAGTGFVILTKDRHYDRGGVRDVVEWRDNWV